MADLPKAWSTDANPREDIEKMIDDLQVKPIVVHRYQSQTVTWRTTPDDRIRESHAAANPTDPHVADDEV